VLQSLEPNTVYETTFASVDQYGTAGTAARYEFTTLVEPKSTIDSATIVISSVVGAVAAIILGLLIYFLSFANQALV
jgi:hypothetical protein